MNLIDRFHLLLLELGISPKVGDPILLGLVGLIAAWITTGEWNVTETRALGVLALYAIVGAAAPPARGASQEDVEVELARKSRRR